MISNTFIAVLSTSLLACLITIAGIYIISKFEKWGNRNIIFFMSFAAGVLIAVSFLHIIPQAFSMNAAAPLSLLIGFMILYIINRYLNMFICHERDCSNLSVGIIPMIGIGLHSFIDGVIYSVTFNVSIYTGALAAIGMVLHEFPEGIVTFLLLEKAGFSRKRSAWYAFLAAAISTPLGALISFPFIHRISRPFLGILLAISAGTLVYVGASHLLPAVEKENQEYSIITFIIGILIAVLIVISKGL